MQSLRIKLKRSFASLACLCLAFACSGCVTLARHAIPANRLPPELRAVEKSNRTPINIALLGQKAPREHQISPDDVLGIYIKGLIPADPNAIAPMIPSANSLQAEYYPPNGHISGGSIGVPITVNPDGTIILPNLGAVPVVGLTTQQAAEKIAALCIERQVAQAGREYVNVSLVKTKVVRVLVVREESPTEVPVYIQKMQAAVAKRGHAHILDLPLYENDVLHALTATGGMPGFDACNEVWILRQEMIGDELSQRAWNSSQSPDETLQMLNCIQPVATAKRIPLWTCDCQPPAICPDDVVLRDGDIVFLKPRDNEYFYTGGLLPGGEVPLPRDRDIDIIEAIAIANGSTGAPGGAPASVFRSGAGPGNIIPPTRAMIVRKLPGKQQVAIRVDLNQAVRNSKERVIIQPGDLVMLNYKPSEIFSNVGMNILNLSYIWTKSE
jgi:protein involved in polysaccharide export with SLBB domain